MGPVAVSERVFPVVGQSTPNKGVPEDHLVGGTAAVYCSTVVRSLKSDEVKRRTGLCRGGNVG